MAHKTNRESWVQNFPHTLELAFQFVERIFLRLDPLWSKLTYNRTERIIKPPVDVFKKTVFDCHECGQCVLHYTGMTCPMTCPKNLRNGPCGGVRADGHCEVEPEANCVWLKAYERSRKMPIYGNEIMYLQPMLDCQREGTSAWVNMLRENKDEIKAATPVAIDEEKLVPPLEK